VQHGRLDRPLLVAARKQKSSGLRKPPIAAQDAEQLPGQHDITLLAALAALDPDDHSVAVDVGRLQAGHLRRAPWSPISTIPRLGYRVDELTSALDVSRGTIDRRIKDGTLKAAKVLGVRLIEPESVRALFEPGE
jgi:hypothetical protein